MITNCPQCGRPFRVPDSAVGKKAQCKNPQCGTIFVISPARRSKPSASPGSSKPSVGGATKQRQPGRQGKGRAAAGQSAIPQSKAPSVRHKPPSAAHVGEPVADQGALDDDLFADLPPPELGATVPGTPASAGSSLAPARRNRRRRRLADDWTRLAVTGAAVVGGLLLVVVMVVVSIQSLPDGSPTGADGAAAREDGVVPGWGAWCVTDDPRGLVLIDIDKARRGDQGEWAQLSEQLGPMPFPGSSFADMLPTEIKHERFDRFVGVITKDEQLLGALHAKEDCSLQQVVETLGASLDSPSEHAGLRYAKVGQGWVGQIDSRVFCYAESEPLLRAALERAANDTRVALPEVLQEAAGTIEGDQRVVIISPTTLKRHTFPDTPAKFSPEWLAVGISMDDALQLNMVAEMPTAEAASEMVRDVTRSKEAFRQLEERAKQLSGEAGQMARQMAEVGRRMTRSVRASSSGKRLTIHFALSVSDIKYLVRLQQQSEDLRRQRSQPSLRQ